MNTILTVKAFIHRVPTLRPAYFCSRVEVILDVSQDHLFYQESGRNPTSNPTSKEGSKVTSQTTQFRSKVELKTRTPGGPEKLPQCPSSPWILLPLFRTDKVGVGQCKTHLCETVNALLSSGVKERRICPACVVTELLF